MVFFMSRRFAAAALTTVALFAAQTAEARTLPTVQSSPASQPKSCTTPGRLMAFLRDRNPRLQPKFASIAVDYMRHGRELGVRWDYAFFQMVLETNALKFTGDVSPDQNNFAGLGATGGGVRGEYFRTVSDGARAHLEHLMIYAGIRVENPVADRTRKVQSWGILDRWRKRLRRAVTYSDVGTKWAPNDRGYPAEIGSIAQAFYTRHCNRRDPAPELLAAATGTRTRTNEYRPAAALGAGNVPAALNPSGQPPVTAGYTTINRPPVSNAAVTIPNTRATGNPPPPSSNNRPSGNQVATAAGKFAVPAIEPPNAQPKCRVWTASYGGSKATIIRSIKDGQTNYTVLDVNPGREKAETEAYIAAYAKGGSRIGDYPTPNEALHKAFKLCPKT
jgi:hypothetical protein